MIESSRSIKGSNVGEEVLRKQTALLESVLDCLAEGVVVCDTAGKFLIFNRTAEQITGLGATEGGIEQWPATYGVFLPDTVTPFPAGELPLARAVRGEETSGVEQFLRNPSRPEGVFVSVSGRPLRDAEGKLLGGVAVVRDITESKRSDKELRIAKEAAEAASRFKSDFLARMSHEIRTPMNGVMGMLDLVLRTELGGQQRELVNTARSSAGTLLRLLDDILDLSRMEAGRLELDSVAFSLRETVGDVMKLLAPLGHEKGLELVHHVQPDVSDAWLGDPGRLGQVLVNLINNAIKFTLQGEIVVRVERESPADQDGTTLLSFRVSDTGMGIPAEKLLTIFEAFAQADTSTMRRFGGSGLGLAIASRLVEQMGGQIRVESEVGRGSTFVFNVRFAPADHLDQPPAPPDFPDLRNLAALIVDDHLVHLRILFELLASWGLRPAMAASGAEALAELHRKAERGDAYALVVLDQRMPDMSGIEVVERIRSAPELAGAILLMLSSGDPSITADRCKELGITLCLSKPIKESELLEAVLTAVKAVGPWRRAPAAAPAGPGTASRPLRILVAEDNAINQRLVQAVLAPRGHTLVMTANGREALAALDREDFDLVLMDVQMPEMDGFQATAAIRAHERSTAAQIPIIALTAHAFKEDRERCLAAGMDAYLAKPIRFEELVELVENAPSLHSSPAPPADPHDADAGVRKQLTSLFVEDAAKIGDEIRDAIARRDGPALQDAAHRLRGTAGYFGADRTLELTARLEQLGKAADFTAETERLALLLSDEIARLDRELSGNLGA